MADGINILSWESTLPFSGTADIGGTVYRFLFDTNERANFVTCEIRDGAGKTLLQTRLNYWSRLNSTATGTDLDHYKIIPIDPADIEGGGFNHESVTPDNFPSKVVLAWA